MELQDYRLVSVVKSLNPQIFRLSLGSDSVVVTGRPLTLWLEWSPEASPVFLCHDPLSRQKNTKHSLYLNSACSKIACGPAAAFLTDLSYLYRSLWGVSTFLPDAPAETAAKTVAKSRQLRGRAARTTCGHIYDRHGFPPPPPLPPPLSLNSLWSSSEISWSCRVDWL